MFLLRYILFYWDMVIVRAGWIFGSFYPPTKLSRTDLAGKNVVITGANTGIGFEMAQKLASMNANVFMACRSQQKGDVAKRDILELYPSARIKVMLLDQASLKSVRQFAAGWEAGRIDVLIHNAGVGSVDEKDAFTEDGLEAMYQINFLASFLLTHLLEQNLAPRARVIFTSSAGSYAGFIGDDFALKRVAGEVELGFHTASTTAGISQYYLTNKLMQLAFARALQNHFDHTGAQDRLVHGFDPGLVPTNMATGLTKFTLKEDPVWATTAWLINNLGVSVEQAGATGVFLSVSEHVSVTRDCKGGFWAANVPRLSPADFYSQEKLDKLWMRWSADAGITWT